MLNGPQRKFCEGIAKGMTGQDAWMFAHPDCKPSTARARASQALTKSNIVAEIESLRKRADEMKGGAVLTLRQKREFLAKVVNTPISEVSTDSDLCQEWSETEGEKTTSRRLKMPSKLDAIKIDNDLSGDGAEAEGNKALGGLAALVARLRK